MAFWIGTVLIVVGAAVLLRALWFYVDALEPGPIDQMGRQMAFSHRWVFAALLLGFGAHFVLIKSWWLSLVLGVAFASLGVLLQEPIDMILYRAGWRGLR